MPECARRFLLVALLLFSGHAAADFAGRPLQQVVEEFRAAGLNLIYNEQVVARHLSVAREPRPGTPREMLEAMLAEHGLALEQVAPDSYIIVQNDALGAQGRLWGLLRDRETGRVIAGGTISVDGRTTVQSAADGQYLLSRLPAGRHVLRARADGYADGDPVAVVIAARQTSVAMLELALRERSLATMVVAASQYSLLDRPAGSSFYLTQAEVENQPNLGEDALRAVNRLPGVTSGGLSAKAHVRGGEEEEVLILFDGMRLRNPYHLKGFQDIFSVLDPGWIDGIDAYTGGFAADYGDRMSAVIDMNAHRPVETVHEVALSFFQASLRSEGTYADGRGEWLVGLRRGNLDLLVDAVKPEVGNPAYSDALAQLRYSLSDATTVSINALNSRDDLAISTPDGEEQAGAEYRNNYFWLKLVHAFDDALSVDTVLGLTDASEARRGTMARPEFATGEVDDRRTFQMLALRQDWRWSPGDRYLARWGFELEWVDGRYDYTSNVDFAQGIAAPFGRPDSVARRILRDVGGHRYGAFVAQRLRLGRFVTAEAGLRWDRQTYTDTRRDDQLSPRVSLLYEFTPHTRLRATWGRYFQPQGIDELQVEDGVSRYFPAQLSEHTILSFEQDLPRGMRLRAEAFRKDMSLLRTRYENQLNALVLLPELQPDRIAIATDGADLQGIELTLRADHRGPWSWWLSYARSHTEDKFGGAEARRSWDQSNAFGFGLTWQGARWSFAAAGSYHTGWPTTSVLAAPGETPPFELGARNAERHADFASLDLRASREFDLARGSLLVYAEISNALNRRNPCCIELEIESGVNGELLTSVEEEQWLPLVPSLGVRWRF